MSGRWSDERERDWQQKRNEADGRGRDRYEGSEDRVFGERDSGAGYNRDPREDDRPDWQDRDYKGVSPGFRQHERDYETGYRANPRFTREDYTGGGRGYGYGAGPRDEGRRFGSYEADERYRRALGRSGGTFSGGTGGYDYERGYGDGGRGEGREFEDRAREAGEFFRRTGRKVAGWFNDLGREDERDYRGAGPKGYKRSDERINDDAHQRLTDDPWLDASDIDVSVSGGEVTLSGKVEHREAKHRAERIVEDLTGVTHVQNNLRVRAPGYSPSTGRSDHDGDGNRFRSEGEASMETSASATGTTTRPKN